MSSQATAMIITDYYAAFNRKDYEGMLQLLDPEVAHDINQGGCEIGIGKFREFLAMMDRYYEEKLSDLEIAVSVTHPADRAAAEFIIDGIYKETAPGLPKANRQKYKLRVGCFFELRNGKIKRVTNLYNADEWVRQVER